jgi:hypothetical protein
MKKIFIIGLMAALFAVQGARAQAKLTQEQKSDLMVRFKTYKEKLNLDDGQAVKVRAIDSTYLTGLAALKQSDARRLAKFQQFKQISAARDKQMKDVLSKDQFKEYAKFKDEMRGELKELRQANNK